MQAHKFFYKDFVLAPSALNKQSLNDLIIKDSPKILAKNAFIKSLKIIEENKDDSYVYPIDESILEDSIHDHSCKVCDRLFDEELINYIKTKKAKLYLISPEDTIVLKVFKRIISKKKMNCKRIFPHFLRLQKL